MKTNEEVIKLTNKEIAHYEIFIEAYDRNKHMGFLLNEVLLLKMNLKLLLICVIMKIKKIFLLIFTKQLK